MTQKMGNDRQYPCFFPHVGVTIICLNSYVSRVLSRQGITNSESDLFSAAKDTCEFFQFHERNAVMKNLIPCTLMETQCQLKTLLCLQNIICISIRQLGEKFSRENQNFIIKLPTSFSSSVCFTSCFSFALSYSMSCYIFCYSPPLTLPPLHFLLFLHSLPFHLLSPLLQKLLRFWPKCLLQFPQF